jgi:sulfate permease, SulP family
LELRVSMPDGTATAHLLRPKLATTFEEGYGPDRFRRDVLAGLTVAVVALPLSMAIAVASGVSPERGLYTAIIGGALVSALGGSRYQIGGPAGAFVVLVAATVAKFGLSGLFCAVFISGAILTVLGLARLGRLVRHIPHAVTVGFTCAIAVTILASQLKDLGGLTLAGPEPGALAPKLAALGNAIGTLQPTALATGFLVAALIFAMKRYLPAWPGMLIAVTIASVAAFTLHIPVTTIGGRFGGVPSGFPAPMPPPLSPSLMLAVLPSALSFALLGAVESLLSAKVADGMTGRKHRSNMELVAQGIANMVSSCFGGICVTGTIARTATNVKAGASSPIAGILHSAFLLAFMLVAAPLAAYVPLAALAGVLLVVCWNMAEKAEFAKLLRNWRTAAVLLATFGVTLLRDLTSGIIAGCVLAVLFAAFRKAVPEEGD